MRGSLWRCAGEQLRPATNADNLAADLVNRYLSDLRWDVQHREGLKKDVDGDAEGHPVFPGHDEDASFLNLLLQMMSNRQHLANQKANQDQDPE